MSIVNDCMSLPESCAFTPMEKRRIDALTKELKLRLQRSSTQPQAEPGVLMLASDLASTLGASKVTNCMSGKDRTGMSVTLEQARWLARNHNVVHPSERAVVSTVPGTQLPQARTDDQLVTLEKKPLSSIKSSRVVKLPIHFVCVVLEFISVARTSVRPSSKVRVRVIVMIHRNS